MKTFIFISMQRSLTPGSGCLQTCINLLHVCCLHCQCLFSLSFPWPCIPNCPPLVPKLGCRRLPVLHVTLLHSPHDFNTPITLHSRFTSFFDSGWNFWLQSLASLSSAGSLHLIPTSARLPGLLDLYFPLHFLPPPISFSFDVQHCPQWGYSHAAFILGQSGNQEIFTWGARFKRDVLRPILHWIPYSLRFSVNVVSIMLSSAANTMSHVLDCQSTDVHWVNF